MENNLSESEHREDDIESESELISSNDPQLVTIKKESFIKKVFKGVGTGGWVVGGGFLYISFTILQFLFVAFAGL